MTNSTPPSPKYIRTNDWGIAAALMTLGFELLPAGTAEEGEEVDDPECFVFASSEELLDATKALFEGRLTVNARDICMALHRLSVWPRRRLTLDDFFL